ncbi:MAG: acyl-ACP--UDP-N-acetylglucosamine O-acyltransferase, partial [Gammaproteobacteria bacterium]
NSEGLKRRAFTVEQIRNIKNAYRVLYRSEFHLKEALEKLRELASTQPEIGCMVEFLEQSERSITR